MSRVGKIVAFDMAPLKTGYSVFNVLDKDGCLLRYGLIECPKVKELLFPWRWLAETDGMIVGIMDLVKTECPDHIVVEQSNLGKQRGSQKKIEWCHLALVDAIKKTYPVTFRETLHFVDSSKWRQTLEMRLNKDQKKSNAKLSKAKRAAAETGQVLDKKSLGIRGKIDWKHLSWIRANERWGLQLKKKDHDIADAINIGEAFWLGVTTNENP